jgi:hypothetical protein
MTCYASLGFIPQLAKVEWLYGNKVVLYFVNGRVLETLLPWVKSARRAKLTDDGDGLDPGDGKDVSAGTAYMLPGRIVRKGRTPKR